jgi:sugar phosphate isomerase/epimerase
MKLEAAGTHLTYCTNVHRGTTWPEVLENLERYAVPIKQRVCPHRPFGVGLWLSAAAARALEDAGERARFAERLASRGLYLFTVNAFPYGAFHATRVKESVYRPDWLEPERLAYTQRLALVLAELLPPGMDGTISTVPGAFGERVRSGADRQRIAEHLLRLTLSLHRMRERTGRTVRVALEPEPGCLLESSADAVAFFTEHLYSGAAFERFSDALGIARSAARDVVQDHLGICYDACHFAVGYEEPGPALAALSSAGIRVTKVQLSSAISVAEPDRPELRRALAAYADDVYLHQVVERRSDGTYVRYLDLAEALASARSGALEWRIHFHVPIFREVLGAFGSTQRHLRALLALLPPGRMPHLEVETYTWDVLPQSERPGDVVDSVVRELRYVLEILHA